MRRRKDSLLAWTLFAIITAAAVYSLVNDLANRPPDDNLISLIGDLSWNLLPIVFGFMGALIVNHQQRNVIGWLMMLPASLIVIEVLTRGYLGQFPTAPAEATPALILAIFFAELSWLLLIYPLLFTMLLFPDGRPPSPRWRWLIWVGLGMCAFFILFGLFSPILMLTEIEGWMVVNPIGILPAETEFPMAPWAVALATLTLLCAAAPFVRYRRASGVEREQIKWLFYACGLFALVYVPGFAINMDTETAINNAWNVLFILALLAVPAAIAIAITRYRLYDIDVIIRKTLVYGALTGALAFVYFGSVVLGQTLFESITGQRSPIVIVISTLLIAALFAPMRRRLQAVINRRFFRQKYDAQLVLAQFAETARDEVELETLTAELARVAHETVQPESVSIWLKP